MLKLVVGRWSWSAKHGNEVFDDAGLCESSESFVLNKLVRVHIFSGRFASRHEENVISHQCSRVKECNESENDERKSHTKVIDRLAERDTLAMLVNEELSKTRTDQVKCKKRGGSDKGKEIAVIAFTDTVVEPDTVMVMGLDAVVAKATVMSTRGTPDIARPAVLHRYLHSCRIGLGRFDKSPVGGGGPKLEGIIMLIQRRKSVEISR